MHRQPVDTVDTEAPPGAIATMTGRVYVRYLERQLLRAVEHERHPYTPDQLERERVGKRC